MLASPPLVSRSLLWLLIQLPAGPSNSLYSKSKETFSGVQTEALMLQKHPSRAKHYSDCGDKGALIDCSCSVNRVWPWAWHGSRIFAMMWSDLECRKARCNLFLSLLLFISFTHLPPGSLGSGAGRRWLLQASQTSEDLTRLWDEEALLHALINGE